MEIKERAGGSNSVVESQPSKLLVAGSIPVSRSSLNVFPDRDRDTGRCSSAVERVLGKDEVTGSSPVIGSSSCLFDWVVWAEEITIA